MIRSRSRQHGRGTRSGVAGLLRAAIGILLLLGSSSIALTHGHGPTAQLDDPAAGVFAQTDGPLPDHGVALDDCPLCELSRWAESEFGAPSTTSAPVENLAARAISVPERSRPLRRARSGQAPRAPPTRFA